MWTFAMFDLPTLEKEDKHDYQLFRKFLIQEGFMMLQYSVYARYCTDECHLKTILNHITDHLPQGGQVRVFSITDAQFGKQQVFMGRKRQNPEDEPDQLLLF